MLRLSSDHIQTIKTQAEKTYPDECCGIMLGHVSHDTSAPLQAQAGDTLLSPPIRTIVELWPVTNTWDEESQATLSELRGNAEEASFTTRRRYWIDPKDMLAAQKYSRNKGLSIIGIYHSHPDHPAVPSECDRACAWPEYSYIIVSVPQGQATDVFSWVLDDEHQFQSEKLTVQNP